MLNSTQALRQLQMTLNAGKRPDESDLIKLVDVLTMRGTTAQKIEAFKVIPARRGYQTVRLILLKKFCNLEGEFIKNEWIRRQFADWIPLLNPEYRLLAAHFGAEAVREFLTPAVNRQQAA